MGPGSYNPDIPSNLVSNIAKPAKSEKEIATRLINQKPQDKMQERIRKQKKWHEMMTSVPSIPPRHQAFIIHVPEDGEDGHNNAPYMDSTAEQIVEVVHQAPSQQTHQHLQDGSRPLHSDTGLDS